MPHTRSPPAAGATHVTVRARLGGQHKPETPVFGEQPGALGGNKTGMPAPQEHPLVRAGIGGEPTSRASRIEGKVARQPWPPSG